MAAEQRSKIHCGALTLNGLMLEYGTDRRHAKGARATIESAAVARKRMTATRVVGGYAVLGPLGALLGGMAKKDTSRIFVIVELLDGTIWSDELPAKQESQARSFAQAVNSIR